MLNLDDQTIFSMISLLCWASCFQSLNAKEHTYEANKIIELYLCGPRRRMVSSILVWPPRFGHIEGWCRCPEKIHCDLLDFCVGKGDAEASSLNCARRRVVRVESSRVISIPNLAGKGMIGAGPIFWEVGQIRLVETRRWRFWLQMNTIRTPQLLHHRFVGYQPNTTWLTSPQRLSLQANRKTQEIKDEHAIWNCKYTPCSFGLSATSQQYFSLRIN
jgi:hypothetical protein